MKVLGLTLLAPEIIDAILDGSYASQARQRSWTVWLLATGCRDVFFCGLRFGDKRPQRVRGILQQASADGTFTVHEAPDSAFIDAETP